MPAAVGVRSYRVDWAPTLSLFYAAVVERDEPFRGEMDSRLHGSTWTNRGTACFPRTVVAFARTRVALRPEQRPRRIELTSPSLSHESLAPRTASPAALAKALCVLVGNPCLFHTNSTT